MSPVWAIINIIVLAIPFGAGLTSVQRLRSTTGLYTARLLPFACYTLASWGMWILWYIVNAINFRARVRGLDSAGPFLHWINFVQLVLIFAAVAIFYSRKHHRWSVSIPVVLCFVLMATLLIVATDYHGAHTQWLESLVWAIAFWAFIPPLRRLGLGWPLTLPFLVYGLIQIAGTFSISINSSWTPALVISAPLLRAVLLFAWVRVMNSLVSTGEESLELEQQSIANSLAVESLNSTLIVMISSTVTDLSPERDAVARAVRSLELDHFRAETFGSAPYTPRLLCESMARDCNLFILVIGERYGHVISPENISIVEHEYNIARSSDSAKILVYVKQVVREAREQEFLQRIEDFDHGYIRTKFDTPEQLFEYVRRDTTRWLVRRVKTASTKATA